ncbi:MAG: HTH domain-containing protein [Kiritimatiellia bacterium]
MAKELTWKKAIDSVLADHGKPMHYSEIEKKKMKATLDAAMSRL